MSVIIPEGFAFVPRGAGVAAKLLEAADEVGADQVTAVRSITGGYHVLEEVAQAYAAAVGAEETEAPTAEETEAPTAEETEAPTAPAEEGAEPASAVKPDGAEVTEVLEAAEETPAKSTRRTAAKK